MPDEFSCKELASAWEMQSPHHAGGQAYPAFREKLKKLIRENRRKTLRLYVALEEEIERERFAAALPELESRNLGRIDRPAHQRIGSPR